MSAEEQRSEAPDPSERGWLRTSLLMALPLAVMWAVAFWITGILWWDAGEAAVEQVPPPEPPAIEAVDAGGTDLDLYTRAHPFWSP
jgi:hypothetical protein